MFPEREQEGDQAVPLLHLITCIKGIFSPSVKQRALNTPEYRLQVLSRAGKRQEQERTTKIFPFFNLSCCDQAWYAFNLLQTMLRIRKIQI